MLCLDAPRPQDAHLHLPLSGGVRRPAMSASGGDGGQADPTTKTGKGPKVPPPEPDRQN